MVNLCYTLLSTSIALLVAAQCPAQGYHQYLLDPVVTHTNGMRLASSTSTRSHNAYWQCDPNHLGYCDGQMYSPCLNDLRSTGIRDHGQFVPPYAKMGPNSSSLGRSHDGLEQATSESLGHLTASTGRPPGRQAPGAGNPRRSVINAPPATAPSEGSWLDALQAIGQKARAPQSIEDESNLSEY